MRTLIHVSIIHAEVDLGSAASRARSRYGKETWARHQQEIRAYWHQISRELDLLGLDWSRVKVYHDSLPAGGSDGLRVVRSLAARGSPNYKLVQELVKRGATLIATEDLRLLLREYELVSSGRTCPREEFDQLLLARDRHMATRIAETLMEGETGVLFVGAAHQVTRFLPGDIRVVFVPSRYAGQQA
ncbi:MAG: hypothetical protein AB1446_01320 [Bacillota bacterium]